MKETTRQILFETHTETPHTDVLHIHSWTVLVCENIYCVTRTRKGFSNWTRCHEAPAGNYNNVSRETQPGRNYHMKLKPLSNKET